MNALPAPIYQSDRATLYCADALDVMPLLEPADVVFGDPPYCSGGMYRGDRMQPVSKKYQVSGTKKIYAPFAGDARDQRQFMAFMGSALKSANVVAGGIVAMYIDWRNLAALYDSFCIAGLVTRGICAWDKTEAVRPTLGRPRQQAEFIIWGTNGARQCAGPVVSGCWREYIPGAARTHQMAKPPVIAQDFAHLAPEGGLVVDPFMGHASTGVGAIRAGCRFIGIEIDPGHAAAAAKRIAEVEREVEALAHAAPVAVPT